MESKTIKVEVLMPDEILQSNESLKLRYDKEKSQLSYEMNENIPGTLSKELQAFLEDETIKPKQIALVNPLIDAVNELQAIKHIKYNGRLSSTAIRTLNDNPYGVKVVFDEESDDYLVEADLEKVPKEEIEKVQKELEKALKIAHDNSYQAYKDGKKIVGSFNSSLREAKKVLKKPYLDMSKKIEEFYKAFDAESTNVKNALDSNFAKALEIEARKKEEAEKKRKAEESTLR